MVRRTSAVQRQITVIILLIPLVALVGCQANTTRAEEEFRAMIGPTLNSRVLLVTDKQQYRLGEGINYWVVNNTEQTLWLKDSLANLSVYHYNEAANQWERLVLLPVTLLDPIPIEIQPGNGSFPEFGRVPTRNWGNQLKKTSTVRLLVHCSIDPNQLERTDYSAYKDVEIVVP